MSEDSEAKGERTLEWDRVLPVPDAQSPAAKPPPDEALEHSLEMPPLPEPGPAVDETETEKLPRLELAGSAILELKGLDTRLARYLHEESRLELTSLIEALKSARGGRAQGFTLAKALVEQGVLPTEEVESALTLLSLSSESGVGEVVGDPLEASLARGPVGAIVGPDTEVMPPRGYPPEPVTKPPGVYQSGLHQVAARGPWLPGKRVGAYQLIQRIGSGGMGTVFLAEHLPTHARYALKTLPPNATDPELVFRLQREGEAQARAGSHPNVATVVGTGMEEGRLYLVMEYVSGGTLGDLLRRHGIPPVERAAQIVRGLALGLDHMHAVGVLHRDIKPANVLMDPNGLPKLVDFGIARVDGALTLTATGEIMGTPAFMSPEQAVGDRDRYGPKMDVWPVGVLLYLMLTGEFPFKGSTYELLTKIVTEDVSKRPRELRPEVPEWLESLCLRALAKDPANRPSAKAMAQEVDLHLSGGARRAGAPGTLSAKSRSRRRRALATIAGLLVAGALFALGVQVGSGRSGAEVATARDPAPPPETPGATTPPEVSEAPSHTVWAWTPGEERRFELTTTTDLAGSRFGPDKFNIELFTQFELRWVAKEVSARWATIEVTIERIVVRWEASIRSTSGDGDWNPDPMDFDSQLHEGESPFKQAVGRSFELDVEPTSGRALVVRSVGEIQDAIYGALGEEDRPRYRIPELSSDEAMRARLNAVIHVLSTEAGSTWKIERGDLMAMGASRGREQQGGLRPEAPPTIQAEFRGDFAEETRSLHWSGSGVAQQEPYSLTPSAGGAAWLVSARIERSLEGGAQLEGGRLIRASVKEDWTSERTGKSAAGSSVGWSASSGGRSVVKLLELRGND